MAMIIRQSTSIDVGIGPFLDDTDGKTAETALTITQPDVRLKKNNGDWAQKAAAQTLTHEENGWYELTLDATDTNTVGQLLVAIHETGALPVWREFQVVEEAIYDSLYAASAAAFDANQDVTIGGVATGAITNAAFGVGAIDAAAIANAAIDAATFAAGAIDAAALAADAVAEIADGVWDEALSGHVAFGTVGQIMNMLGARTGEINDLAGTTTVFIVDGFTEATNDHFNGMVITFTSGACLGQSRTITDYVGATQAVTIGEALTDAPADGDDFVITPGQVSGGDLAKVLRLFITILDQATGQVDNGSFAAGAIDAAAIATNAIDADALAADALAEINSEVVDALNVDTYAEPGQGAPAATASLAAKIGYLYKNWRNRKTQTSTTFSLYADDATTVDQKATVADDGATASKTEIASGP